MKFAVDNQLSPALAQLIQTEFRGGTTHAADIDLRDATDAELWSPEHANRRAAVGTDRQLRRGFLFASTRDLFKARLRER